MIEHVYFEGGTAHGTTWTVDDADSTGEDSTEDVDSGKSSPRCSRMGVRTPGPGIWRFDRSAAVADRGQQRRNRSAGAGLGSSPFEEPGPSC
ncbi:hypothetical protein [Embleya sp. NBC_00896]|uniref:hypothetical protein n=1 Tax=Embleya sp. NBC_00896 TaxID=2975961 RepID=UPI0038683593|nr:hypothetical protein OG928_33075 [Embleya sp. NBC_00896]